MKGADGEAAGQEPSSPPSRPPREPRPPGARAGSQGPELGQQAGGAGDAHRGDPHASPRSLGGQQRCAVDLICSTQEAALPRHRAVRAQTAACHPRSTIVVLLGSELRSLLKAGRRRATETTFPCQPCRERKPRTQSGQGDVGQLGKPFKREHVQSGKPFGLPPASPGVAQHPTGRAKGASWPP